MKVIGPILTLIALYVLSFLDYGALFVQLVDRLGLVRRVSKFQLAHRATASACVLTMGSFAVDIKLIAKLLVCHLRGLRRPS
jgi:hypothetical protein